MLDMFPPPLSRLLARLLYALGVRTEAVEWYARIMNQRHPIPLVDGEPFIDFSKFPRDRHLYDEAREQLARKRTRS